MGDWQRFSFLQPKAVKHEVDGQELSFYPVSVGKLAKLREVAKPIAAALSVLFTDRQGDSKVKTVKVTNTQKGEILEEATIDPTSDALLVRRETQKSAAIENLIEAFSAQKNISMLAGIICDSLRDDFARPITDEVVEEFSSKLSVDSLYQLLAGVMKANSKVFDPLVKRLKDSLASLRAAPESQPLQETQTTSSTPSGTTLKSLS